MTTKTANATAAKKSPPPIGEGLAAALARLGYTRALPASLAASAKIDARAVRFMACACGHRGHRATPMHRRGSYVVVASCNACHSELEV